MMNMNLNRLLLSSLLWLLGHDGGSFVCSEQLTYYYNTSILSARNYTATEGNPMKGFAATFWQLETAVVDFALEYNYIRYDQIITDFVNGQNVYNWPYLDQMLDQCKGRNRQMVPRLFINYPPYDPNLPLNLYKIVQMRTYTDYGGGKSPFYGDANLLNSVQQFIAAYGARYDGDPRIAYIQTGLVGFWAEWHTLGNPFIPDTTRQQILNWYGAAFKKTKVMTRYPSMWAKSNMFGYHDDSWTAMTLDGAADGGATNSYYYWPDITANNNSDVWRYAPLGGETRPENVATVLTASYPRGTSGHQDFWLCATTTHTVYMKYGYFPDSYSISLGRFIHTNMGYNFQVRSVAASTAVSSTGTSVIHLGVTIQQVGYTPFYYPLNVNVTCPGMAIPRTATGVEQLIDQFQTKVFVLFGLPYSSTCLNAVQINLTSPFVPSYRPIKFAQGINGAVTVSIPLPTATAPTPLVSVTVPTPVAPITISNTAPVPIYISVGSSSVIQYYLVNTATTQTVSQITAGSTYSKSSTLTIQIVPPTNTMTVRIDWTEGTAAKSISDTSSPYLMGGNTGTTYNPVTYLSTAGTKTITVTCTSSTNVQLAKQSISFMLQ